MAPPLSTRLRARLRGMPRTPREVDQALQLLGSARVHGWYDSAGDARPPVDGRGDPLPWWSFPAIEWVGGVLRTTDRVFEWGSGNSTRWLSQRVSRVISIEHDGAWAERAARLLPGNAEVRHIPEIGTGGWQRSQPDAPYVRAVEGTDANVFVVDGMARMQCADAAAATMGDGLLILDNSDVQAEAVERLSTTGLHRIDFVGIAPGAALHTCTTVFSRRMDEWLDRALLPRPWPSQFSAAWRFSFDQRDL